jgi:hypothetical protein
MTAVESGAESTADFSICTSDSNLGNSRGIRRADSICDALVTRRVSPAA